MACSRCGGKGGYDRRVAGHYIRSGSGDGNRNWVTCPACAGGASSPYSCPDCGGVPHGPCRLCGATGTVRPRGAAADVPCPVCGGAGYPPACATCGGSGWYAPPAATGRRARERRKQKWILVGLVAFWAWMLYRWWAAG